MSQIDHNNNNFRCAKFFLLVIFTLACVSTSVTYAQPAKGQQADRQQQARKAAAVQDWLTVITLLESSPAGAERNRLLGLAYYQERDLERAQPLLRQAAELNPADQAVNLALLETLLAKSDYAAAAAWLERIPDSSKDIYRLYRARIATATGELTEAQAIYQRLLQSQDRSIAQEAAAEYIQILQQNGDQQQAYNVAQQALRGDSDSFLSYRFAQVEAPSGGTDSTWAFSAGYRFEYDDNVALLPDQLLPAGNQDEDDFRHVLTADAIYQLALPNHWLLFGEARGSQSLHHQASEFDFTRLNALLGTGQAFDHWGWRLPAEISHDRFDGDGFSTTFTVTPGAYLRVAKNFYTHLYGRYASSDFEQVSFPEDDRSAEILGGGLLLSGHLSQRWSVRGIVEYLDYDADGSNWDRSEQQVYLYTEYGLTTDWSVGAGARYTEIDFDNLNIPFLAVRQDESWEYFLSSTYQVATGWYLRAQLSLVDHQSNIAAFDYDRLVTSLGLSWRF